MWHGKDPSTNVVLLEDLAAVLGVGIAASCMGISYYTGTTGRVEGGRDRGKERGGRREREGQREEEGRKEREGWSEDLAAVLGVGIAASCMGTEISEAIYCFYCIY